MGTLLDPWRDPNNGVHALTSLSTLMNISGLPVQVRRLQINKRILSPESVLDLHIYTQIYTNSVP